MVSVAREDADAAGPEPDAAERTDAAPGARVSHRSSSRHALTIVHIPQAPQRERVSQAQSPTRLRSAEAAAEQQRRGGRRGSSSAQKSRRRRRRWTDLLAPDRNMGVPQLMMILEPNIVWDHVRGFNDFLGKRVEATYCPGEFFEGWHKAGRLAHGVYEGNYWELIGDADEMIDMLRKMARAPALLDEPVLSIPAGPDLPKWEDFKPHLQALPSTPDLPQLKLPPFRAPILDSEVPFIEPLYIPLPDVPDGPQVEKLPAFSAPEELQVEELVEPEYVSPEPPVGTEAPAAPVFGKPAHGHDWTGNRPFVLETPAFVAPRSMDIPRFLHPPRDLPRLPLTEDLQLDRPELYLDPIPRFELAWECGPDPEPSYSSPSTSRASSPPRTMTPAGSRPSSALPSRQASSKAPSPMPSRPQSAQVPRAPSLQKVPSAQPLPSSASEASAKWSVVVEVEAGKPRAWINFEKPFAELPPIFFPPMPELGVVNGREPQPEDFPHEPLEAIPDLCMHGVHICGACAALCPHGRQRNKCYDCVLLCPHGRQRPECKDCAGKPDALGTCVHNCRDCAGYGGGGKRGLVPLPIWVPPKLNLPKWMPPCEPRPVGFLRGTAPILIIDVSGTMNPRINGKFKEMKACACEMLDPVVGEIATAAGAFDVIAFCSGAWSWSSTFAQRMSLLSASQTFHSGRQVGGKPRPGSSRVADKTRSGTSLQPTEPDLLADAQNWVDKWPDAVGHTSLLAAFQTADEHWAADSWYAGEPVSESQTL